MSLIRCGGKDPIASEREQWNDASNTLCISPGVVAAYDRNGITNNILRDNGITVLEMPQLGAFPGAGRPQVHEHAPLARLKRNHHINKLKRRPQSWQ